MHGPVTPARENVIHETGLFQGRLGFSCLIVILEESTVEFSNIQDLSNNLVTATHLGVIDNCY